MVPLPGGARTATLAIVGGYFISSQAQHPDACWQWISFLSEKMPPGAAPTRKSLAESNAYERLVGRDVTAGVRASMEDADLLSPSLTEFDEAFNIFGRALDGIVSGRTTPEEAMTQAQQEAERMNP